MHTGHYLLFSRAKPTKGVKDGDLSVRATEEGTFLKPH